MADVSKSNPVVSLVVPIFNEEALVERLHVEIAAALNPLSIPWQVVYVNDGSRDQTLPLLLQIQQADPHVVVVELSRNWGHQPAVTAGLSVASGAAVVLMDGDLQDPPAVIPDMIQAWKSGAQVVIAVRKSRAETGLRALLFPLFYKILGSLSDFPIPLNAGIFGLLDRSAVDAINHLSETNRYLPGLRSWIGYKTATVFYDRQDRAAGKPKQTFFKLFKYALDAIFSFSYKPLRISLAAGLIVSAVALIYGIILLTVGVLHIGLFGRHVVEGYTTTITAILFLGGIQLISVGILGEYIGRIYDEVKRRPLYLISKIHQASPPSNAPTV